MLNSKTIQYPFDKTDLVHMQDLVNGSNVVYEGWAAAWQKICKHTYDGSNNRLTTKFASGTNDYNQVWDDRVLKMLDAGFGYEFSSE